jgi:predicted RNA-binding protein YlxR (DUF448 family)
MVDPSGKQSGRGAYLCVQRSCWETALKRGSLDRALKITLDDSCKAELSAYAQTLPQPEESPYPETMSEVPENQDSKNVDGE